MHILKLASVLSLIASIQVGASSPRPVGIAPKPEPEPAPAALPPLVANDNRTPAGTLG
jgi:hypothetical protein